MDQIFNELSANGSYADKYAAKAGMERMARLFTDLQRCGFNHVLRVVEGFAQLPLAPDYSINHWLCGNSADNKDIRRQLLSASTRAPYVEKLIDDEQTNCLFEFRHNNQIALGLGLACLWGSAAVSLDGDAQFTRPRIDIKLHKVCDKDESIETVSADSVATPEQVADACQKLKKSQLQGIKNGGDLVKQFSSLFPLLECGSKVSRQLSDLKGSEQFFPELMRHFEKLNSTMGKWHGGPFKPEGINWSGESESTLSQFRDERTFLCNDGEERVFEYHSKLISSNWRIYFYSVPEKRKVHIGYVGKHLPTIKHPK